MKKTPAKGHTSKHTGTKKHHATAKHHPAHHRGGATAHGTKVHTVAKHPKHAKARGLALADGVACCSAEALAASLRLLGARVDGDDVLALHWATVGGWDAGAPILAALEAASVAGLAGYRPAVIQLSRPELELALPGFRLPLVLGLELPGPHAVTVDVRGRWWSWGQPYDPASFPRAVLEEAWAVSWS